MKLFLSLLFGSCLMATSFSQTQPEFLKTKALQFGFSGLYLRGVGVGVGGKIWADDETAYSLSIGGNHSFDKSDASQQISGVSNTQTDVEIQVGIEKHTSVSESFSPYVACALSGGYRMQDYKNTYVPPTLPNESKYSTTTIGFLVGFGAEYWIARRISFSGQHLFQASYDFGTRENIADNTIAQKTHGFTIGLGTTSLILSLYF